MMNILLKPFLFLATLAWAGSAQAGCVSVVTGTVPAFVVDPFASSQPLQTFNIIATPAACSNPTTSVEFWFRDDVPPPPNNRKIGNVPLEFRYSGQDYLSPPGNSNHAPDRTFVRTVGSTLTIPIDMALILGGGTKPRDETREFSLYYRSSDDPNVIRRVPLRMALRLAPSFQLSANGDGSARLDFGSIEAGEAKSMILSAKGTQPFRVTIESLYGQALRWTSTCGAPISRQDPLESVNYRIFLGGREVSLQSPYADNTPAQGQLFEKNIPMLVDIAPGFDPNTKRAGDYCDIIKLRILAL